MSSDNLYQMDPIELYSWLLSEYEYEFLTPVRAKRVMKGIRRLADMLEATECEVIEQLLADTMFAEAV